MNSIEDKHWEQWCCVNRLDNIFSKITHKLKRIAESLNIEVLARGEYIAMIDTDVISKIFHEEIEDWKMFNNYWVRKKFSEDSLSSYIKTELDQIDTKNYQYERIIPKDYCFNIENTNRIYMCLSSEIDNYIDFLKKLQHDYKMPSVLKASPRLDFNSDKYDKLDLIELLRGLYLIEFFKFDNKKATQTKLAELFNALFNDDIIKTEDIRLRATELDNTEKRGYINIEEFLDSESESIFKKLIQEIINNRKLKVSNRKKN